MKVIINKILYNYNNNYLLSLNIQFKLIVIRLP